MEPLFPLRPRPGPGPGPPPPPKRLRAPAPAREGGADPSDVRVDELLAIIGGPDLPLARAMEWCRRLPSDGGRVLPFDSLLDRLERAVLLPSGPPSAWGHAASGDGDAVPWVATLPAGERQGLLMLLRAELGRFPLARVEGLAGQLAGLASLDPGSRALAAQLLEDARGGAWGAGLAGLPALPAWVVELHPRRAGAGAAGPAAPRGDNAVGAEVGAGRGEGVSRDEAQLGEGEGAGAEAEAGARSVAGVGAESPPGSPGAGSASAGLGPAPALSGPAADIARRAALLREPLAALRPGLGDPGAAAGARALLAEADVTGELERVLEALALGELSDDVAAILCRELLPASEAGAGGGPRAFSLPGEIAVLRALLLPRVGAAEGGGTMSRALHGAALGAAAARPRALAGAVVAPMLAAGIPHAAQGELLARCVKEGMQAAEVADLLERAARGYGGSGGAVGGGGGGGGGAGGTGVAWTEHALPVLLAAVGGKQPPPLSPAALAWLVAAAEASAPGLPNSVKFVKLLFTLLGCYGRQLQPHRDALRRSLALTKTFMTKSALARVEKL